MPQSGMESSDPTPKSSHSQTPDRRTPDTSSLANSSGPSSAHPNASHPSAANPLPWQRIRLAAPQQDSTLFARPAITETPDRLTANTAHLNQVDCNLQGRSFQTLRQQARDAVIESAATYTSLLRGTSVAVDSLEPLIVSGHQPALFHPGVWAKNFAIAKVAAQSGGRALNLVVDNDTLTSTRVRVPTRQDHNIQIDTVDFDTERSPLPWEDAKIVDADRFNTFADRVSAAMNPWDIEPLISQGWDAAKRVAQQTHHLRDALTAARHSIEHQWGLDNLELPLSHVSRHEPFLWFASHLLVNLRSFAATHNAVLDEYRLVNRIRSQTHPVPPLAVNSNTSDWQEAPFWVWNDGDSRRRRVFARQAQKTLHLSDGEREFCVLPITPDMDACCAVEALQALEASGIRFRTRALTTTLYSRLMLADMFVHGIGGAKYDEMTDRIIHRFYGIHPPAFQVISATVRLPLTDNNDFDPSARQKLIRQQRDLRYNPQSVLAPNEQTAIASLLAEKQQLIEAEQAKNQGRFDHSANYDRYQRLRQITLELQQQTLQQQTAISSKLANLKQSAANNALTQSREFSFCLFPESKLRPFLTSVANG